MSRITILLEVDGDTYEQDRKLVEDWKAAHRDRISFISENEGCGCCVDIWNIECEDGLVSLLPPACLSFSDWSNPKED